MKFRAGKFLDLSTPKIMGVLNITPNSFSSVGRFMSVDQALQHAEMMFHQGAAIIDVGGEATNPGVHPITSEQEELDRVIPIIEALSKTLPIPLSVDTSKPNVMKEAIQHGAAFINDVRALRHPESLQVIAETGVPVCLMHMSHPDGQPNENSAPDLGEDPITVIKDFLHQRIELCLAAGITQNQIVIDPGIGHGSFGKNQKQNLQILNHLEKFQDMPYPLLLGVSRKTFLGNILNQSGEERLYGSLAATTIGVMKGASIIRTHDVKETIDVIKVTEAIFKN